MALSPRVARMFKLSPVWWLATSDGAEPNLVPVGFKQIWGDRLLIVDLYFGETRRNLAENPYVAVAAATIAPKAGYRVVGKATIHRQGEAYDEACALLAREGVSDRPYAAVVVEVDTAYLLDPGAGAGRAVD